MTSRDENPLAETDSATGANNSRKRNLQRVAWLLDNSIAIPFTSRKIGLDALIGLIPGLGDAAGGLMSTWILMQGVRYKVPALTLMFMVMNVALEVVIGFIPFFGDLFDMAWKANHRNVQLLERYIDQPGATARSSAACLIFALLFVIAIGVLTLWSGLRIMSLVWGWISMLWAG